MVTIEKHKTNPNGVHNICQIDVSKIKSIPIRAKIMLLLDSNISGYKLSKNYHISPIKISHLRNKKASLDDISLVNIERLERAFNDFLDEDEIDFAKSEIQVSKYDYFFNENDINSSITDVYGIYSKVKLFKEIPGKKIKQENSLFPNEYGETSVTMEHVSPYFIYKDKLNVYVKTIHYENSKDLMNKVKNIDKWINIQTVDQHKSICHLEVEVCETRIPKFQID